MSGLGEAGDGAVGILSDLGLEDQRLIKAFLSLAGAGDLLTESMELSTEAYADGTAAAAEAEKRYATTESQLTLLKNNFRDVGFTIGSALLPAFGEIVTALMPVISGFADSLKPALDTAAAWLGENLPVAIAAFTDIWNSAILPALQGVWDYLQTSIFPVLQTLWGWLAENLPTAIAFINEHWESFKGALIAIGAVLAAAGIVSAIAGIVAALNPVTLIIGAIIAVVGLLGYAWADDWGGIQEKTQAVIDFLMPFIQGALDAIRAFWDAHGEQIMALQSAYWDFIKALFTAAFEFLSSFVSAALEEIRAFWDAHGETIMTIVGALWDVVEAIFSTAIDVITSIFRAFTAALEGDWEGFGENLKAAWDSVWALIQDALHNAISAIQSIDWGGIGASIINGIVTGVSNGVGALVDAVKGAATAALDAAKELLGIDSPSKVFASIVGEQIPAGIAVGIERNGDIVQNAVGNVVTPKAAGGYYPVASAAQTVQHVNNNSREVTVNFTGNYQSAPAVRDSQDLALILGMAGVA